MQRELFIWSVSIITFHDFHKYQASGNEYGSNTPLLQEELVPTIIAFIYPMEIIYLGWKVFPFP